MKICAAKEHVPEIERYFRTITERVRGTAATLPTKGFHNKLIVKLVYKCVLWLNSFLHNDAVHPT